MEEPIEIAVMYQEGKLGRVKPDELDDLIKRDRVIGFKRSDGWAVIGEDPIRQRNKMQSYHGLERRRSA